MSNGSSLYLNAIFGTKLVSLWSPLRSPALRKRVGLFQSWQEEQARSWRCCQVLSLGGAVLGQILQECVHFTLSCWQREGIGAETENMIRNKQNKQKKMTR